MAKAKVRKRKTAKPELDVDFEIPEIENALVQIEDLIPDARNSRKHTEKQISLIAKSIREYGFTNPVLVWKNNQIIAGHARVLAAEQLGVKSVPVRRCDHLSDTQRRALVIADNKLALVDFQWDDSILEEELRALHDSDFDLSLTGFDDLELPNFDDENLNPGSSSSGSTGKMGSLSEKFIIPPFSVLNAREGWWQDRKKAWLSLGIKSEVGRGENLLKFSEQAKLGGKGYGKPKQGRKATAIPGGGTGKNSAYMFKGADGKYESPKQKAKKGGKKKGATAIATTSWVREKNLSGLGSTIADGSGTGTSIFDPVICELAYSWFCPKNGQIIDPFAGGSVRGIVASKLRRNYFGIDLRPEQIDANREQAKEICKGSKHVPKWVTGDSVHLPKLAKNIEADFIFSCPPYADLEVYSDDPADLSTMEYNQFRDVYFDIIGKACAQLKQDRFACFVVGEVRHKKTGHYYDFVGDTVQAFKEAGLEYHNEAILVTAVGSLPIRAGKQFSSTRRFGKTHQNVLVFVKGDPKKAAKACGEVDVSFDLVAKPAAEGQEDQYGELL